MWEDIKDGWMMLSVAVILLAFYIEKKIDEFVERLKKRGK